MISNNPPEVVIYLTRKQAEFIIKNCDTNIAIGLAQLLSVSQTTQEKLVGLIEEFKEIKVAANKGLLRDD